MATILLADDGSVSGTIKVAANPNCCCATWKTLDLFWGPEDGTDCQPMAPTTLLNPEPTGWQDVGFDDSAWADANLDDDPSPYWTPHISQFVSSGDARDNNTLINLEWLARAEFTIDAGQGGGGTIQASTDNWCQIFIDGQQVASMMDQATAYYDHISTFSISVAEGDHCLSVRIWEDCSANSWTSNPNMVQILMTVAGKQIELVKRVVSTP